MVPKRKIRSVDTATQILDIAERLVQHRGFNAFSYADIADELGITKASLHYHFAGKAELGESLVVRYSDRFGQALAAIDGRQVPASQKLTEYCDIYRAVLEDQRMCLCGMLAAEYDTLPFPMRTAVTAFFDRNQAWLTRLLKEGRKAGDLRFVGTPEEEARNVIAALEGAMLVSRPYGNTDFLESVAEHVITELTVGEVTTTRR